jgi:hypothetical protein
MRELVVLGAVLVAAVASKRRVFARAGLAAALAVTLLWMGGHGAQADSFNPTWTVSFANTVADTPSDITFQFDIPEGDVMFGPLAHTTMVTFAPTAWQITPSSEIDIGVALMTRDVTETIGLMNGPCNTPLPLYCEFLNATTDKSQTVTFEDGFDDSNGDGNIDFIDMYPDFNDRILGPAQPVVREVGIEEVGGVKILAQTFIYEPGATIGGQTLDPALGRPLVNFHNNQGDPEVAPMPGPITDDCTPLTATAVGFGTAEDGTVLWKNPKEAGTYTTYTLFVGLRDADGDGHDNTLDTCPLAADADWDPRAASAVGPGDADGDGLPSSCDPDDNDANADEDGDGYSNRGDNCPLMANGVADADNQKDSDFDGIGDACDPNPNDADSEGEAPEVVLSQDVTITAAAAATPSPTVAPPTTPAVTPAPAATPAVATVTPTVVAPPPTGAGSASGGSWAWWPLAIAGAAAGVVGALLAWQAEAGARR